MKKFTRLYCICAVSFLFFACAKEKESPYEKIAGRWTISSETIIVGNPPYGPFSELGFFATSSSDVILHEDKTYTPLQRQGSPAVFMPLTKGTYEYIPDLKKIVFNWGVKIEYLVKHFKGDDLWIEWDSRVYKFKRA